MWAWCLVALMSTSAFSAEIAGTWQLDLAQSDALDPLLEAQGVSRFVRGIVRRAHVTQHITDTGDALDVTLSSSVIRETRTLVLDGKERQEPDRDGRVVFVKHERLADGTIVSTTRLTTHDGQPGLLVVRRRVAEQGRTMRLDMTFRVLGGDPVHMVRVFHRSS